MEENRVSAETDREAEGGLRMIFPDLPDFNELMEGNPKPRPDQYEWEDEEE